MLLELMKSIALEEETVLVKYRHLILALSSYRRDLSLVR
jgi:hypothetical protein